MKKQKIQILMIHGGETFRSRKDYLKWLKERSINIDKRKQWAVDHMNEVFGKKCEIIRPRMPLQENALYEDWKIFFELHFPYLRNNLILIGSSLGGVFLAKYLSENKFHKKLLSVYLVCPPFDGDLPTDDLVGGFELKKDLSLLEKNCKDVTLMFSADDDSVPVDHAEKYRAKLPNSKIIIYKSKNGHFNISKFPEIVKMIEDDVRKLK